MIEQDLYEYEFIKRLLNPTSVCLDIGANVGYFTQLMAKYGQHVYALEPDKDNFKDLEENMKQYTNCNLVHAAVSNYYGNARLYKCNTNNGMHRIYPSKYCSTDFAETQCTTIDELFLSSLDFAKIDVEGSELNVLQGMEKTIVRFKPEMVIEFHPPSLEECGPDNPRKVYDFLKQYYKSITLLATSFIPASINISEISYQNLIQQTQDNSARNIHVI